jgi:Fur family peroxide stress response transcriptional regulator
MQHEAKKAKVDEFIQICQSHQLKITPQRVAIYQQLLAFDQHPTADTIYQAVKKAYPNISFDTVNRTLLTFADIGLLEVVEIFGGAKRFDTNPEVHHHMHCTRCGRIEDFVNADYDHLDVPNDIQELFKVMHKRVVLKGICKGCRK